MTPKFKTVGDAVQRFKRCRKVKGFILEDDSPDLDRLCDHCGRPLKEGKGNRCEYRPNTKSVLCFHYYCAWEALMSHIIRLGRVAYYK